MRAKRSKKYRKIMSQYQMTFSFREPYQVLLDSNFLKACHHFHMPLQKYLENTLHGECRLFVTKCTLAKIMGDWEKQKQKEEKSKEKEQGSGGVRRPRGPGRPEFLPPPTEVPLRHCKHKNDEGEELGVVSEGRCLLDLLAGQPHGNELAKNKQHYILATADADDRDRKSKGYLDVRERARMIPGVPIVYVKRSVMILEELSGASESVRRKGEREKLAQGLLSVGDRKRKRADSEEGSSDDEDSEIGGQSSGPRIRGLKKAKGPNPLSVKKKKVKQPTTSQSGENGGDTKNQGQDGQQSQSKRKRKRRHAGAKQQSATADDAGRPSNSHASTSAPASEAVG
ncbi:hypothetical protein ABEF92_008131 [Exophiala dermatitidis]|uniref:UTP23 sensor motif region domain-containing protein n=1 Tax=Exophiala dermatitidis (strain ATCC 34100 / CBS 525.76 / NIH/UT8656) TaxID=858893 RepID=H6BS14_EXODN|nr:uncharacterized protein HMPREF1120_02246 [Exophiala dermatitidis NIH/UT8656]EHY54069.1 hypothetical protein HMPREF1120_02246 [Exophiala dermatitidis NIH/UT8656]